MATKEEVLSALERGSTYPEVGAMLGIPPGQAYLIATGLPADGSDSLAPEDRLRPGLVLAGAQELANPASASPSSASTALEYLHERARRDAVMRNQAMRRDAMPPQAEPGAEQTDDIIDRLSSQHNEVKKIVEQLEAVQPYCKGGSSVKASRRQSLADLVVQRLAAHEWIEEAYFWPFVRDMVSEGSALVDQATAQEQAAKETCSALAGLSGEDKHFDELVEELTEQLRKHVALEDSIFLEVKARTSPAERAEVARRALKATRKSPTRPHPRAASSGTKARLGGSILGASDRMKDAVGSRPANRRGKAVDDDPVFEG